MQTVTRTVTYSVDYKDETPDEIINLPEDNDRGDHVAAELSYGVARVTNVETTVETGLPDPEPTGSDDDIMSMLTALFGDGDGFGADDLDFSDADGLDDEDAEDLADDGVLEDC